MSHRVTSFDVAKKAGVSRGVVSAVLNNTPGIRVSEETRFTVMQAIEELGYRVDSQARGMRLGRSQCFAAYGNMENPLFLQMLQGFQKFCALVGYHVLLYGTGDDEHTRYELVELYRARRIDGIVGKDSTQYADEAWAKALLDHRVPYVSVDGFPENNTVCSVLMDYNESIKIALDCMSSHVSSAPAYIEVYTGPNYCPNWGDVQRLQGYKEWMSEHNFMPRMYRMPRIDNHTMRGEWLSLVQSSEKPAVLLTNWSFGARRVYEACQTLDLRIGKDVHLMASDNTEKVNAHMTPPLSAVEVPYSEMGARAAERLIHYVTGERELADTSTIWVPTLLELRGSL